MSRKLTDVLHSSIRRLWFLGMELNYATGKVNIHSCQLKLDLEENKGGHPILKFPKPTQYDLNNVPMNYRKANEIQQTHVTAQRKVQFEVKNDDINKIDDNDMQSFVHEADMVTIKKGTRKKLFGNVKDAREAFEEGAKERPPPQPAWHVDTTIKKRRRLSIMEICTWTMMVTMIAMQRGWDTWQPITIESGYGLTSDKGIAMAKLDIEKANPDVIVFAWVCTPWTLMQNMNNKVPGHAERLGQQRSLHLKMLAFAGVVRATTVRKRRTLPGRKIRWDQSPGNNLRVCECRADAMR